MPPQHPSSCLADLHSAATPASSPAVLASSLLFSTPAGQGRWRFKIPVLVSDLDVQCALWLKLRLAPMCPWIGTISLAFVGPPAVKVQLSPYNRVRLMRIPVLQVRGIAGCRNGLCCVLLSVQPTAPSGLAGQGRYSRQHIPMLQIRGNWLVRDQGRSLAPCSSCTAHATIQRQPSAAVLRQTQHLLHSRL